MIEQLTIFVLLAFLVAIIIAIILLRDLLVAVILLAIYSLTASMIFIVMDAVDVAFTEAAVGAGVSTIFLLGALKFTEREQKPQKHSNYFALIAVLLLGVLLIYGTLDMPNYGDANAPAYQHPDLARYFLEESAKDTGVPNVVTSVLASYRGYDTLGETVVVFTAAVGVMSLLGLRRRNRKNKN